ncbi:hypothetical protein VPNG_06899 [Cytospora leucostoma]|uniref:Gfo/Idh/MocA-like oxidoreductase N-terminal domain-containing protein n=1 Tax=Cytospora leucostoma TaxID=1230097 RepID=A0A423WXF7_9PEZI|nr:hypothetical protein VPNG_06899 [Cytospora leucostoma]
MSTPTPVPIAIIGGGIFIKEQHLPAVLATPYLSLKVIYSRSLKSAKETSQLLPASHGEVELYSEDSGPGKSYTDVLARPDIVGVLIALPIINQPEYIKAALEAGKHVFSEKPIGPDVKSAKALIKWYRSIAEENKVTWAVAEQFRFLPKYVWGAQEARKLGKVIGFNFRVFQFAGKESKYYQTEWRQKPAHNYGFLLDGGVHAAAAVRLFLGDDVPDTVVGYSFLAQQHLAPVDTLSALIKTKSGAVGSFNCSWGTTLKATEYSIALENGSVTVEGDKGWILYKDGRKEERDFPFTRGSGVLEEVEAWGKAISEGKENPLITPETTLGDLELLEYMLRSGDENGQAKKLQLQ